MKAFSFGTDVDGQYFFRYNPTNRCVRLECYSKFILNDPHVWHLVESEMWQDARGKVGWLWHDAFRTKEKGYAILGHCDTPLEVLRKVKLIKEYL